MKYIHPSGDILLSHPSGRLCFSCSKLYFLNFCSCFSCSATGIVIPVNGSNSLDKFSVVFLTVPSELLRDTVTDMTSPGCVGCIGCVHEFC